MPFIRHAHDKRGYDTTFVLHAYRGNNGASRTRVLYVFRSPAGMKVGRRALEPEVVEALEHTHPDLSFDWPVLLRDSAPPRVETRERWQRPGRSGPRGDQPRDPRGDSRGSQRGPQPRDQPARPPAVPVPSVAPVIIDDASDASLLGRTVGAREAARLRGRYHELLQRIARRARTPEDRDRLNERARRLNPEDWLEDAAIRTAVATIDTDWGAIAVELPSRRRGRRGGRFRGDQPAGAPPSPTATSAGTAGGSGIITGEGESTDEEQPDAFDAGPLGQDARHADAGDRGGFGADARAAAGDSGQTGAAGAGARAEDSGADGADVPVRDGDRLD